jgi:transcriptional regulator with XRE-family HTH domain
MDARRQPRVVYLSTVRHRLKWTQGELAERSGVSQPNICRLERRSGARPGYPTVRRLAAALGIDSNRLRFGPDPAVVSARLAWDMRRSAPAAQV